MKKSEIHPGLEYVVRHGGRHVSAKVVGLRFAERGEAVSFYLVRLDGDDSKVALLKATSFLRRLQTEVAK